MRETPPSERRYQVRRKVVVHQMRPASPLARALAFVVGVLLLMAVLFVSLIIFSIVLTVILLLAIYAWWTSRSARRRGGQAVE
jgi:hypothetical protein